MASAGGAASAGRRRRVLNSLSCTSPCNEHQQFSNIGVPSSGNKESLGAGLIDGYKKCMEAKSMSECIVLVKDSINGKHSDGSRPSGNQHDEEIEAVSPIPPHHHGYYHHPAMAPAHPPASHHHHHHHHAGPPSLAPSHHHHAPVYAPMHSPAHAPIHPPMPHSHSPVHPPVHSPPSHPHPHPHPPVQAPSYHFPRSFVAVQGVVYCKSCKYSGVDTLLGATPVLGATVKLQCNNTKYPLEAKATTDKNGYFYLQAPKSLTSYGAHKCKVSLVSAPTTACSKITDLHGGLSGAMLRPEKKFIANNLPFVLYNVGPFAFEPKCPR